MSNFLRARQGYTDITKTPAEEWMQVREKPADIIYPDPWPQGPTEAITTNSLLERAQVPSGAETYDITPPVNNALIPAVSSLGAQNVPAPQSDVLNEWEMLGSSPYPNTVTPTVPTNALLGEAKPTVAGMPINTFAQLMGMGAHALDPKGFGGILGKDIATYAGHQETREENNALRKLQMEHTNLQNKKLKAELDPNSFTNAIHQIQFKQAEQKLAEDKRKTTKEILATATPENFTAITDQLTKAGVDTSRYPKDITNSDTLNKWINNEITTAEERVKYNQQEQKDRFKTVTIYNEAANTSMQVTYDIKKEPEFKPAKKYGLGWSMTVPKTTQPRTPTAFSSFVEEANAKGWDAETRNKEWEKRRTKEAQAKTPTAYSDFDKEAIANGWDITTKNKIWEERRHSQDSEGKVSKTALATAETTILLNASNDIKGAQPKVIAPQVNLFNTNTSGDYIYTPKTEDNRRYIGSWNVMGDEKISWEKTTLPVVEGKQVTGKDIDRTAKEKGMAFEAAYEGIKSGKVKPAWKEKGGADTKSTSTKSVESNPDRYEPDISKPSSAPKGKNYDEASIQKAMEAAITAGADPQAVIQNAYDKYGKVFYINKRKK